MGQSEGNREARPAGARVMAESSPSTGAAPQSAGFDLSFCVLGVIIIVCGMLLTFRFAMSPENARFLGAGDSLTYYGPMLSFMDHSIHEDGQIPLWNPLYFCGQPHAANPQSFVFYPPNLLRSLLTFQPTPLRTHVGIAFMVLGQTVVAGIGALLLARRHGYSYAAALLAGFAFPFSGALVTRTIGHWIFLNCACWVPWMLLCAHTMVHGRGFFRRVAAAAKTGVLYGCCILGGVPVLTFAAGVLLGAYWLLETAAEALLAGRAVACLPSAPRWKAVAVTLLSGGALLGAAVAVSAMLASPLLLPLAQFARQTGRAGVPAGVEDWAPLNYGWELFKTLIFYQGHLNYEGIRGGGAAVISFAVLALFLKPRWNGLRWSVLFAVILDLSVSNPLLFGRLLRVVAPFISNCPGRAMAIGCLPLAMLAGWGLDAVTRSSATARRRAIISVLVIAVGGTAVGILLLAVPPGGCPVPLVAMVLPAAALVTALLGLWLREHLLTGIVAAMLVLGEVLAWNAVLLPANLSSNGYPGSLLGLSARKHFPLENRRVVDENPNMGLYGLQFFINGYDPLHLLATRNTIAPRQPEPIKFLERILDAPSVTVHSPRGGLFLKRRFWLVRKYCAGPLPGHRRLFPPARVAFLSGAHDLAVPATDLNQVPETGLSQKENETNLLDSGQPLTLKRQMMNTPGVKATIGMADLGGRHGSLFLTVAGSGHVSLRPVFTRLATGETQSGMQREVSLKAGEPQTLEFPMPDGNLVKVQLRVDFLDISPEVVISAASAATDADDEDDHIRIVHQTANGVELHLSDLPGPRLLLFVDSFYDGWKATVNGGEVPILPANDAFKAIVVPAGTSEVRFTFTSGRVSTGIVLSGVAVALAVLAVFAGFRERRQCPGAQS